MKLRRQYSQRYQQGTWVEAAAARLVRSHGSPAAALVAIAPGVSRAYLAHLAPARSADEEVRSRRFGPRYSFWVSVRTELRDRAGGVP